jgi:hypothetical protein
LIARDNDRRQRLNAMVRAEVRRDGRLGDSVHVAGHEFAVGDRVIARRNDRLRGVDNGTRGTVIAVDPNEKDILVRTDTGGQRSLDTAYATEHLQHAYALTAHTIQGGTVEWAAVVGHPDDFTRNWAYTALSRAREPTELFLIDAPTERELDRADIAPTSPPNSVTSERPSNACRPPCAAATTRTSPSTASTTSAPSRLTAASRRPAQLLRPSSASGRLTSCGPNSRSSVSSLATTRTSRRPASRRTQRAERGAARGGRGSRARY